jgi:hypothetical protein
MYWRDATRDREASGGARGFFVSICGKWRERSLIAATGGRSNGRTKGYLVHDKSLKPIADNARPNVPAATHKFALGTFVTLVGKSEQTLFKVTRLLPDGGSGLQYRIKSEREDYERVAIEPLLAAARR